MRIFPTMLAAASGFITMSSLHADPPSLAQAARALSGSDPYPVIISGTAGLRNLDARPGEILLREFDYACPENTFKQSGIHPKPDTWNWEDADRWLDWAEANGKTLRIHGPISPQCSRWAREDDRTGEELAVMLDEFFTALCEKINDHPAVHWMDVINETVEPASGNWFGPRDGTDAWENPWPIMGFVHDIPDAFPILQEQGVPRYIIRAFEIAKEKAPDLKLVINQHGSMNPAAWEKLKELVLYLRSLGLRVDGLGWQAHIRFAENFRWGDDDGSWDPGSRNQELLSELIAWCHAHDLEFHITEMDIYDRADHPADRERLTSTYRNIMETLLQHRASGTVGWNTWTLTHRPHWNISELRIYGLWDEDGTPTEAYQAVLGLLQQPPEPILP